jgi:YYY domain-containing protein
MAKSIGLWYVTLQGFALIGWPLAFAWLRHLPSRGFAAAKALGLLLTGVVFWWGGSLRLWHNTTGAVVTAAFLVLGLGLWLMRGRWREAGRWWRSRWRFVLTVEILFLVAFVAWALVRASQPMLQTAGGEKWMEIAFLNAILRAPAMPPHDPWLSGFAISYYYLGYVLMAILTRVAAIPASIAFNLSNAGWFALTAVGGYGLVYDLLGGRGVLRALIGPLMMLVTGNGEGLLEVFHARGLFPPGFWQWMGIRNLDQPPVPPYTWQPQRFFWWWQASRTLQDTTPWGQPQDVIDEFPAFSFILGDMHPHLLALPFVVLTVILAYELYRRARTLSRTVPENRAQRLQTLWERLVGPALLLGALGFLNTWDLPIYGFLIVGAVILGRYLAGPRGWRSFGAVVVGMVWDGLVLGILSLVLYLPFWLGLRSQAGGILPNVFNATKWQQFVVMFLPLLVPLVGLLVAAARRAELDPLHVLGGGVGLILAIAVVSLLIGSITAYPYVRMIITGESVQGYSLAPEVAIGAAVRRLTNPWVALALAIGVSAAVLAVIRDRGEGAESGLGALGFPLLMAGVGLLLTLAPEFVYLKDVFMTRMNTIFKFYFQAWVLWSLAGAWMVSRWIGEMRDRESPGWSVMGPLVAAALLIAAGLVYTFLAVPARAQEQGVPWTLDGAAWLTTAHPADDAAIDWLQRNVTGAPVITETPADEHAAYVYEGRISALTGLPTVLGWSGHERQWRGTYDAQARREVDLKTLYTTPDLAVARTILDHYHVTYVYVGPVERRQYPESGIEKFGRAFPAVYESQDVTIYRVDGDALP